MGIHWIQLALFSVALWKPAGWMMKASMCSLISQVKSDLILAVYVDSAFSDKFHFIIYSMLTKELDLELLVNLSQNIS